MTVHIQRFVDRVNSSGGARDFVMPLADARLLSSEITHLLLTITELQSQLIQASQSQDFSDVTVVGGRF